MRVTDLRGRLLLLGGVASAVVAADLLTKAAAGRAFADGPTEILPSILTFTYTENTGASFSILQDAGTFLSLAAFAAIVIVVASVWNERATAEVVGFAMIGGGAVGNLVDRLARGPGWFDGPVIDWIQFPNFPVFNLADSAITVGVAVLILVTWRAA